MAMRKKNKIEAKSSMLILAVTDAETTFFNQLRKDLRYSNLTVLKSRSNTLDKLLTEAGQMRTKGKYSSVWCIFGLDEVNAKIEDVARAEESAAKKGVNMLYFDPSFDLYFALFAEDLKKIQSKEELKTIVEKAYPGFELSQRYFLTDGLNLNFKIYPRLAAADLNARTYNEMCLDETGFNATSLPLFFDSLKEVCGKADMSQARNRF